MEKNLLIPWYHAHQQIQRHGIITHDFVREVINLGV